MLLTMMVACLNAQGKPDLFTCQVEGNHTELKLGLFNDKAAKIAEEAGYKAPFIVYGQNEQENIAKEVSKLQCPVPFSLTDTSDSGDEQLLGQFRFDEDGIQIHLDGYNSERSADYNHPAAFLEYWGEAVNFRMYTQIDHDGPTYTHDFENAKVLPEAVA